MSPAPARHTLSRLWAYARPHRGPLLLASLCNAALGLAFGGYAWLMGPALGYLLSGGAEGLDRRVVPLLQGLPREALAWAFPLLILAVAAVKGVAYLGQFYFIGLFAQRAVADLRRDVFRHLVHLSPARLARERQGDLLGRLTSDVAAVELAAAWTLGAYIRDTLQVVVLAGVALWLSPVLGAVMLLVIPVAVLPASRLTRSVLKRNRAAAGQLGQLSAQLHEGLGGMRTIQAFNGQAAERRRFADLAADHERSLVRAAWARGAVPGLMEVLAAAAIAGGLAWAASTRAMRGEDLLSFLMAVGLLYQPVKELGRMTQFGVQGLAAGERLFELLDAAHPVQDAPGALDAPPLREGLRVEDVTFAWGERRALDGLTLELPRGRVLALVGPSGSGKSTLAALLLRFERPQGGRILLDGVDVERYRAGSVRAQFALVTQEPLLFPGSVLDNLRYARPDATREEVEAAARVAHADGFVRALPQGYDTLVGERGVKLSGGQRQRLCIARAVLARASVLVLDEATASLDPESEREVQAALAAVLPGRTALVIAHRLRTVTGADAICVLEEGRVVEQGTHEALLARGGRYAALWRLQERSAA